MSWQARNRAILGGVYTGSALVVGWPPYITESENGYTALMPSDSGRVPPKNEARCSIGVNDTIEFLCPIHGPRIGYIVDVLSSQFVAVEEYGTCHFFVPYNSGKYKVIERALRININLIKKRIEILC